MASVYEQVMGSDFELLPFGLAKFHSLSGRYDFKGKVVVLAASNFLARIVARLLGLPLRSGEMPIAFTLVADSSSETWVRNFSGHTMRSTLYANEGFIAERLGPVWLKSGLAVADGVLQMRIQAVSMFGLAFPAWCMPRVIADETSTADTLFFNIEVRWAWIGVLVGYSGSLDLSGLQAVT